MKQNRLLISGIDTDAKWGFSKSKGWIFGYKLHMSCSTGKLSVPLSANLSTANVHDSQKFDGLIELLLRFKNILTDPAYDDGSLYDFCVKKKMRLICSVKIYPSTPPERINLADFYHSIRGQKLYSQRKVSIEPLFEVCV